MWVLKYGGGVRGGGERGRREMWIVVRCGGVCGVCDDVVGVVVSDV